MEETSTSFGAPQLFLSDVRLALVVLNHVRYEALRWAFGVSREQANALTAVLVLSAADGLYMAGRKVADLRPPAVSASDAGIGAVALRDAALSVAGPANRAVPGFDTLLVLAMA